MFGPKLTPIFKSRWMALLWAAGIVWMAVDFVGPDEQGNGAAQPVNAQDMAALDSVFGKK